MVEWTLYLCGGFLDAVENTREGLKSGSGHSLLLHDLAGSRLPEQYPKATANLVLRILRNSQDGGEPVLCDLHKVEDIVRRVAMLHVPAQCLRHICDELARLGYPRAAEFQAELNTNSPNSEHA